MGSEVTSKINAEYLKKELPDFTDLLVSCKKDGFNLLKKLETVLKSQKKGQTHWVYNYDFGVIIATSEILNGKLVDW